jgi:hypothetical protein
VSTATKARLIRTVLGGLVRMSFRAGRLVGIATASRRGAEKSARNAGLRARQFGSGTRLALEKAPQLRRELRLFRRELAVKPTTARAVFIGGGVGLALGVASAYFLDPQSGGPRREVLRSVLARLTPSRASRDEGPVEEGSEAQPRTSPGPEAREAAEPQTGVTT